MAADGFGQPNLSESGDRQKPTPKSKFRWLIMKIVTGRGFWKAALQIPPAFCHEGRLAVNPASPAGNQGKPMGIFRPYDKL
jgi:hypothetical protein